MTRVITTVRHAATANAARRVITGTLDEALSDVGRAQARDIVARFGLLQADAVISSPLSRCVETAQLLTGCEEGRIERWEACIERNYGLLQGLPPEEVAEWRARIRYVRAGGIDHSVNPPGGETLAQVRARAKRLAAALAARPEPTLLVVSHQILIQQLHGILMGISLREALAIDIAVLQIDEFEVHDGGSVTRREVYSGETGLPSW